MGQCRKKRINNFDKSRSRISLINRYITTLPSRNVKYPACGKSNGQVKIKGGICCRGGGIAAYTPDFSGGTGRRKKGLSKGYGR